MKSKHCLPAGVILVSALGMSGCAGYINEKTAERPATVDVRVAANAQCELSLRVRNNPCVGVGTTNGVVCGRPNDEVRWRESGKTTIEAILYLDGKSAVCLEGTSRETNVCTLKPQDDDRGRLFKYEIRYSYGRERCKAVDPYIIIVMR